MCGNNVSKALIESIEPELRNMLGAGRIAPDVYAQLTSIINDKATEWAEELSQSLKAKAKDWEQLMPPEEQGFYSLALRRSADYITGRNELDDA